MIPSPDSTRKPIRRPYAPLEATRPHANAVKRAIPASAPPAAVEDWENEGGHLRGRPRAAIAPSDVSPVAPDRPTPELAAMEAKFKTDFADGLIGRHHNTYHHRARVLRQLAAGSAV